MKFASPRYYAILAIAASYQPQQVTATQALLNSFLENPSSYWENPSNDSIPMVPAPMELTGVWTGTNCVQNSNEPVLAELQMVENGVNLWSFQDKETGHLVRQTGRGGVETMVGFQCIGVGRGYWWGMVPDSDIRWCNLFQVQVISSDENTTVVSYINLAHGDEGECPTHLSSPEPGMVHLQASFTKRVLTSSKSLDMTCNVPSGSTDRVQPSHNSQFAHDQAIPNPFLVTPSAPSVARLRVGNLVSEGRLPVENQVTELSLPILSETTCQFGIVDEEPIVEEFASVSGASNIGGFAIAAVITSIISWMMV